MDIKSKKCLECGGNTFAQGTDYINLRPLDNKLTMGSEKIYTFCVDCGEVHSVKIVNPNKLT